MGALGIRRERSYAEVGTELRYCLLLPMLLLSTFEHSSLHQGHCHRRRGSFTISIVA